MGRKTRMRPLSQSRDQGWGLFEILLAVVLAGDYLGRSDDGSATGS